MAANFWEAGAMRRGMDTHINTSVRPNGGALWFNWADAWEEEEEEEKEEEEDEEEKKMEEAGTKKEHVKGKYEKLRRLKAAGEIKEYEIDWDEMWRECAQRKEEEGMSHFGQESAENGLGTPTGQDREGPQTKDRSHLHSSRGKVVVAAASEIAPRVLGKVPAQSSDTF